MSALPTPRPPSILYISLRVPLSLGYGSFFLLGLPLPSWLLHKRGDLVAPHTMRPLQPELGLCLSRCSSIILRTLSFYRSEQWILNYSRKRCAVFRR